MLPGGLFLINNLLSTKIVGNKHCYSLFTNACVRRKVIVMVKENGSLKASGQLNVGVICGTTITLPILEIEATIFVPLNNL